VQPHLDQRKIFPETENIDECGSLGQDGRRPGGSGSAWMDQGLRTYLSFVAALRRVPQCGSNV